MKPRSIRMLCAAAAVVATSLTGTVTIAHADTGNSLFAGMLHRDDAPPLPPDATTLTQAVPNNAVLSGTIGWGFGITNMSSGLANNDVTNAAIQLNSNLPPSNFPGLSAPADVCPTTVTRAVTPGTVFPVTWTDSAPLPATVAPGNTCGQFNLTHPSNQMVINDLDATNVPVTYSPGFDSSRTVDTTSVASGGTQHVTVAITTHTPMYTGPGDQVFVGISPPSPGQAITSASGPGNASPTCPAPTPTDPCFQFSGNGPANWRLLNPVPGTVYDFQAVLTNTGPSLTSLPGVFVQGIPATSLVPAFSATSITVSDQDLDGGVRFSADQSGTWQASLERAFDVVFGSLCQGQGCGPGPGPGPGPAVNAEVDRFDTMAVGDDVNSVASNQTFPNLAPCGSSAPSPMGQSGCRSWFFDMLNNGPAALTGAQVAVDSTVSGLALNDTSEFNFEYSTQLPGFGSPPALTPCPPPGLHQETCPVPGVSLAASGGGLQVSGQQNPQTGVPITPPMTAGYDSARLVSAPANGISQVTVPITLRDSSRFGASNFDTIGVGTFNGNVVAGSATVIGPDGTPVPPCTFAPPPGPTCANPPSYATCQQTQCSGPGQVCTAAQMFLNNAQLGATYSFEFQEYVVNTSSPTTGNCGFVKPALRISVNSSPLFSAPTPCCSAFVDDPALGRVTFSIDPGQATSFQAHLLSAYVVQYSAESQLQVQAGPVRATEGQAFSGPVATLFEGFGEAAAAGDYPATIDWGDGVSTSGTVSGPNAFGMLTVNGTHTYSDEGVFPLRVTVTDADTPWNQASNGVNAGVGDLPLSAPSGQTFPAVFPVTNTQVASFSDANSTATCADFNGTISVTWDGTTTTPGSCSPSGSGFTVTTTNPAAQPGLHAVTVNIVDDGGQSATAANTVIVGGFASGGSFVIGDRAAALTGSVTFWGAQWATANTLSGGAAPAAFKGFVDSPAAPGCGQSWSSDPGNSGSPPASIPSYLAVIVASTVTQSGSTIAGNAVHVVIVKTDPGYGPQPSTPGTGTIVAVLC